MAKLNNLTFRHGHRHALLIQARVVLVLMLRDIKTRMGASYFGFILGLILPLGHIGVVTILYILAGRRSALGNDVAIYLTSAILPFIIWSYTHQKMIMSVSQNFPLTYFPIVSINAILISRSLAELLSSSLIVVIVFSTLAIYGSDLFIANASLLLFSGIMAYLLGVATGMTIGVLSKLNSIFMIFGFILIPLYWITSGVLFIPESLPDQLRSYLSWFALSHIVDLSRMALFPSYISYYPSPTYVIVAILANFLFSFGAIRFLGPYLSH